MAVTVITKKRGRPLVTGDVGVSIINWTGRKEVKANQVKTNCMHTAKKKKKKSIKGSYDNMRPVSAETSKCNRHQSEKW